VKPCSGIEKLRRPAAVPSRVTTFPAITGIFGLSALTASTASSIFSAISFLFFALTAFGFVFSTLTFLVSGGFFVLLYFVAAEALFLIPTGLQYAAATLFTEYARVVAV
jgi:hypothetical protein